MRRVVLVMFACLLILPLPASAQFRNGVVMVDLAERSVNITAGFTGARLALFGIKKQPGDVAIVILGPERRMVVRRKGQVGGIWMNTESVSFRNVPVYYDLALSKPADSLADPSLLERYEIGLDALNFEELGREDPATVERFREALIRTRQLKGFFPLESRNISYLSEDFFRADFNMPANVPTGDYQIKTYLFQQGNLVSMSETQLRVAQVGFNASLYRFAHYNAFAYGLAAVFLAVLAGGAGWIFLRKD